MEADRLEDLERRVWSAAREFAYPPTPDIAGKVTARLQAAGRTRPQARPLRRLSWALAILAVACLLLASVPAARAQILEWIQLGAVRIFRVPPTPGAPTASPSPTLLPGLLELDGQTTLEEARERFPFPVRLPSHPSDLGQPDFVFIQDRNDEYLILVWLQPGEPGEVRLSLHQLGPGSILVNKWQPTGAEEVRVNDAPALWTTGPYLVETRRGEIASWRLIEGHVLIWTEGEITYRLETSGSLEEALQIAESLE